jgi:hypothetical protein
LIERRRCHVHKEDVRFPAEGGIELSGWLGGRRMGRPSRFPKEPVRRRIRGIETFNVLCDGEYFFMPSISALKWLGNLNA